MVKILLSATAVVFTWILMSGCSFSDDYHHGGFMESGPPSWAPAHGYRQKHAYHYYYDHEVYYHVARREYSWLDGGRWHVGVRLPAHLHINIGSGHYVAVNAEGDRPQAFHHTIKAQYPPGLLKKSNVRNQGSQGNQGNRGNQDKSKGRGRGRPY